MFNSWIIFFSRPLYTAVSNCQRLIVWTHMVSPQRLSNRGWHYICIWIFIVKKYVCINMYSYIEFILWFVDVVLSHLKPGSDFMPYYWAILSCLVRVVWEVCGRLGIWGPWKCGHTWSNPFRWLTNQIIYYILITSCQINEWFSKYLVYKYTWRDFSRFMLLKLKAMVWPFLEPTCGSLVGYNHSIPELVEEQSLQETTLFNG